MAKGMDTLNSSDHNQIKEKGFIFAFISLGISAIQGIGKCVIIWKFTSLGVVLGIIFGKSDFSKIFAITYFFL